MTTRLDISIGPVQGFVSQSRRTRDLWGSSYLLAFLSAQAMRGAREAGGRIVQPVVDDDPLWRWVDGDRKGEPPCIGTLPNRFVVDVEGEARPVAEAAVAALEAAWKQVCGAVWARFVEPACPAGNGTETIWRRQAGSFWEVAWTAGPSGDLGGQLARRKHWRSHRPPDEPGDKCTVMPDLQELSGYVRAQSNRLQDEFWQRVRDGLFGGLDLGENERLCAVALVKRLFPRVSREALGWRVDAVHWPSTIHVGALPWIRRVMEAAPDEARKYAEAVQRSADNVLSEQPQLAGDDDFPKLDANYFHRDSVRDKRRCPLRTDADSGVPDELAGQLKNIYDTRDEPGRALGPPSSFYALLLADGDRLGKLVGELGGKEVSKPLASFTRKVPKIVRLHNGSTVYAGGDDVLSMLPADHALTCANALSDAYRAAFSGIRATGRATLSAAVSFAHVRLPLRSVLDQTHRLLDEVAKDGNGRDSLVAAVLKPGGLHCQWVTTWDRAADDSNAVRRIDQLVGQLDRNSGEPGLSSALIYRIRKTMSLLCGRDRWLPGDWGEVPGSLDVRAFLRAEVFHSLDVRMDDGAGRRAEHLTDGVCAVLRRSHATGADPAETATVGVDALLLARFLAESPARGADR